MKKGDIVTVDDSSYSYTIIYNRFKHIAGGPQKEKHIIMAVNCKLPADRNYYGDLQYNDTIIRGQISGKITFTQQRFLKPVPPKHKIMIDMDTTGCIMSGSCVEISDELYRKIKNEQK